MELQFELGVGKIWTMTPNSLVSSIDVKGVQLMLTSLGANLHTLIARTDFPRHLAEAKDYAIQT